MDKKKKSGLAANNEAIVLINYYIKMFRLVLLVWIPCDYIPKRRFCWCACITYVHVCLAIIVQFKLISFLETCKKSHIIVNQ